MKLLPLLVAALLLLVGGSGGPPVASAQQQQQQLPPFDSVVSCAPFTVLVEPAAAPSVALQAEPGAAAAVDLRVANATLYVSVASDLETRQPLRVTARVPAGALRRVAARGAGAVVVAPGFKPSLAAAGSGAGARSLRLEASGAAALAVRGLDAAANASAAPVSITAGGHGRVFLAGNASAVDVEAGGAALVVVDGAAGPVDASVGGVAQLYANPSSDAARIDARLGGLGSVAATRGDCSTEGSVFGIDASPFFAGVFGRHKARCGRASEARLPELRARWACGLRVRVRGEQRCAPDGATAVAPSSTAPAPAPAASPAAAPATTSTAAPPPAAGRRLVAGGRDAEGYLLRRRALRTSDDGNNGDDNVASFFGFNAGVDAGGSFSVSSSSWGGDDSDNGGDNGDDGGGAVPYSVGSLRCDAPSGELRLPGE